VETSLEFSKATEHLREAVREWAVTQVRPLAREADRLHRPPEGADAVLDACPVDMKRLGNREDASDAELEAVRADGANVVSALLYEEMCYGDHWPIWTLRGGGGIGPNVVRLMGTEEQKHRWVGGMIRGEMSYGAFALTEPHFGSDVSQVATTATRVGDAWVLNGTKMYCSMGASADYVVVFATIDKKAGRHGIRAFIVERGTPGFRIAKRNEDKLGIRCAETSELLFENAAVPLDHCLGWNGDTVAATEMEGRTRSGFVGAVGTLASSRPFIASMSLGLARAAKDVAAGWVEDHRLAFTPPRLSHIENELEQMDQALLRARRMILLPSWMKDRGMTNTREASAAKAFGPPIAERVIRRCVQLMGPDGISEEYLVEKWYRDIKIFDIFEGSGQIQRITVSRQLMGPHAARG
jgi:acyl-CoA dehydrogenase